MKEQIVQMRATMLRPPKGVQFCLQRGKAELVSAAVSDGADLVFEFEARAQPAAGGSVRLLGPFVQGPPAGRFLYICVGTYAGQIGSRWSRRVKVPLTGIPWEMVKAATNSGGFLEAAFEGTMKDGSPAAASVKLTRGWTASAG